MSGFTNLIYFKDKPSSKDIEQIKTLLESYGQIRWDNEFLFLCDFTIPDKNSPEFGVRIYSSDTDEEEFDSVGKKEFIKTLNYVPKFYIGVMGIPHTKASEMFVAQLLLKILQIKDGLVDLSSVIDPEKTDDKEKIRSFVQTITGHSKELYYEDVNKKRWFTHLVDKEFLANWTKHEKFYIPT